MLPEEEKEEESTELCPIANLHTELLFKIFAYIDVNERLKLEEGNKSIYSQIKLSHS